jgi:hypothetical protein
MLERFARLARLKIDRMSGGGSIVICGDGSVHGPQPQPITPNSSLPRSG